MGFDSEAVRKRDRSHLHLGIYAMAERIRLAEGALSIDSAPGRGTRVIFSIPAHI